MPLLRNALRAGSALLPFVSNGVGAIAGAHRNLIAAPERARVGDSMDLDSALEAAFPNQNRWDYVLSVPDAGLLVGVEPHTSADHEISVVIKKKQRALEHLREHLQPKYGVTRWYWATSGRCMFSSMERARRRLDAAGIQYVGRQINKFQ